MRKWWYHWMLECLSQETWSYQREKWCYHHQEHDFDHRNCRFFHYKCFNFGMQSSRAPVMTPVGLVLFIDRINVEKNWSLGSLNHKYNHYRPKIHHLEMISYGKCAWVVTRHGLDLIQDNFDDRFLKKTDNLCFRRPKKIDHPWEHLVAKGRIRPCYGTIWGIHPGIGVPTCNDLSMISQKFGHGYQPLNWMLSYAKLLSNQLFVEESIISTK